jgi:hypothetical protein
MKTITSRRQLCALGGLLQRIERQQVEEQRRIEKILIDGSLTSPMMSGLPCISDSCAM